MPDDPMPLTLCSWCPRPEERESDYYKTASHGICESCYKRQCEEQAFDAGPYTGNCLPFSDYVKKIEGSPLTESERVNMDHLLDMLSDALKAEVEQDRAERRAKSLETIHQMNAARGDDGEGFPEEELGDHERSFINSSSRSQNSESGSREVFPQRETLTEGEAKEMVKEAEKDLKDLSKRSPKEKGEPKSEDQTE